MTLFKRLPEEMQLECFSHLTDRDLCRSAAVSKCWNNLATDTTLWPSYSLHLNPDAAKAHNVPTPRVCHTAVCHNNKMYIFGGHNPLQGSNFISDVKNELFEYDLDTSEWTNCTSDQLPTRTEHACVVVDKKMFIVGGYSSQHGYRNDLVSINLETKEVKRIDNKSNSTGRSAHTAVVYKGDIYIFGGWNGTNSNNDFMKYNIARDEWSTVDASGEVPAPRRSHNAIVHNNNMYIWGGFNGTQNLAPVLHKYDFFSRRWSAEKTKNEGPCGRSRARSIVYKNKFVIFGGWDRVTHFNDWFEYNFDTKIWEKKENVQALTEGLGQHSAAIYLNRVYVFGGYYAKQEKSSNALWTYCLGHLSRSGSSSSLFIKTRSKK